MDFCEKLFSENSITHLIHCAAKWNGHNQDSSIFYNNVLAVNNILFSAKPKLKKIVFISSSGVYGDGDFNESINIPFPKSSYGISKLLGEKLIIQFSKIKKFDFTIYRPFHLVSPEEVFRINSSHVCTDMCYKIFECNEVISMDKLSEDRHIGFTWVEDFVDAIIDNLDNFKTNNQIFNIGTSELHSVRDLVNEILVFADENDLNFNNQNTFFKSQPIIYELDSRFKKIKECCDWERKTNFSNCIAKYITHKYL